jgi:hypothetical protein
VDVGESDTIFSGCFSIVTDPFGASIVTGNPGSSGAVVDEVVVDELDVDDVATVVVTAAVATVVVTATVAVVPSVAGGASAASVDDPHAAATSAIAVIVNRNLRDTLLLLSREERSWKRQDPSSEGAVAHRGEGDLARPRRASQLRDSAGFTPDFASQTALGQAREEPR